MSLTNTLSLAQDRLRWRAVASTRSFAVEGSRYGRKGYGYLTD